MGKMLKAEDGTTSLNSMPEVPSRTPRHEEMR